MALDRRKSDVPSLMGLPLKTLTLVVLTFQFSAFILLLHYSRVMPTPDGHRYLPSTAVFLVELLRLGVCFTIALYELASTVPRSAPATTLFSTLAGAIFGGDSWKMALPAGLYTLANSLQYIAISNLDAATFQVTYQFKIIVTAIFSVIMLNKSLNLRQWLSLVMLMVGVAIVSMPQDDNRLTHSHHTRVYLPRSLNPLKEHFGFVTSGPAVNLHKRSATYEGIEEDELALSSAGMDASIGLVAVFCTCMCSGLAGVYFEKTIKETHRPISMWIRNVQLSLYSLFPAFFIGVIFLDGETVGKFGFFAGYNWIVVVGILVQTFGAIVAAFCMFYADNISKNFAISISMVISAMISVSFFGFELTGHFLIGTAIVLASTYMYTTQSARRPPPPSIRIYSDEDEKAPFSTEHEPRDVSIQIAKTPLVLEDSIITTSRPGTPSNSRRKKNDSGSSGYFIDRHY